MFIRPVTLDDHKAVLELAKKAGIGMTSLPPDPEVLLNKILRSVKSFDGKPDAPHDESFLFVLEDPENGAVVGTTGVVSHVGLKRPFYSYKLLTLTQASEAVKVYARHEMLHVVNDLTGASEIGSLFLQREYRRDKLGRLLSRCRYLLMAEFPDLFAEQIIAEIRGMHDGEGNAPFYDGIARHFFQMEFQKADYINATQGNQFIQDLVPHYPIYVELLPPAAREVIGKPFTSSEPAKALLEKEGFRFQGYVDIFDAGPTMIAERSRIKTVRESKKASIVKLVDSLEGEPHILHNCRLQHCRFTSAPIAESEEGVQITIKAAEMLQLGEGDALRYIAL